MSSHQSFFRDSKTASSKSILQLTDHILQSLSLHPVMGLSVFMFPHCISPHLCQYEKSQENTVTAKLHPLLLLWLFRLPLYSQGPLQLRPSLNLPVPGYISQRISPQE